MEKKKKIMLAVMLVAIIMISIIGTYAYFVSETNNDRKQSAVLKAGTMALTFEDNDDGINEKLMFGESVTKKFKITNTGSLDASLSLDWNNFINTYMNGSLSYNLSYATDESTLDLDYEEIIPETNMPTSEEPMSQTIASELSVPTGETYYYNLKITLNNLPDTPQDDDLDAVFFTNFGVDEPVRYRYYTLSVDPNGGTWGEYVSTQEYLLKNKETMTITNSPTRTGYTFAGWKLSGISSKFELNVFTMGIGNSKLVAEWTPNKHTVTVTINGETREIESEYGGRVDLGEPPVQDGYTFTGWEATGGTVEGNNLTITEDVDVSVKPTYVANKYKYIVYHKQQNITNDEYTLVSADTDEGEADYNSKVTPELRDYTGFVKPEQQSLTIKIEDTYPPELNKVEYNYDRERHTLTVNSNGGSYSGSTSQVLKYEQSITLGTPAKTGYNFTNWSASSGIVDGTTFKMETSDAVVTANYTAKEVTINFNANGGTTSTASKTAFYDSTYGDLPTPTYSGYKFLGWFTASSGGTQVTSSTEVKTEGPVTLFAQWEEALIAVTLESGEGWFGDNESAKTKIIYVEEGKAYGEALQNPNVASQHAFECWSTTKLTGDYNRNTPVTADTIVTNSSPHTLYAIYRFGCFLSDTLVYTPNGYKTIQDIKVGDEVYSYNEYTKQVEIDEVSYVVNHPFNSINDVTFEDGTVMHITWNHTVYDPINKEWKEIGSFKVGDYVQDNDGNKLKITNIDVRYEEFTVYNFTVKNNHNYFVTKSNILVHNIVATGFGGYGH